MTGMEITEFYAARLDEAEAAAWDSGPARIAWLTYRDDAGHMLYTTVAAGGEGDGAWAADGKELAAPASARVVYDPARKLRDVEAKRKILALYKDQAARAGENAMEEDRAWTLAPVIAMLAAADSGHPDYNPAWAPAPVSA
jgi:Family of unknown function (DUF6221)